MNDPLDLDVVRREIDAEVRRLRMSGEIPDGYEAELDAAFARHAPPAVSDDFDRVLDQAERDTGFQYRVPTASSIPGGSLVKRTVQRAVGWYVLWFVRQISGVATTIARAIRLLARRVDRLEAASGTLDPRVAELLATLPDDLHQEWSERVAEILRSIPGRVAIADAGADGGEILKACLRAGIDAYGVEPRLAVVDALAEEDLEVRHASVIDHLERVDPSALGALVLVGCAERLPPGDLVAIGRMAPARIATGGRIVVVSSSPAAHRDAVGPVVADLFGGRPLDPRTWDYLFRGNGCDQVVIEEAARDPQLQTASLAQEAIRENFARVEAALFPAPSYAVVATRT